jgi:two-component system, cell cycle sensor histidine kinase PleC
MTASAGPPGAGDAGARLALMDHLLGEDDASNAAQIAVEWLGARIGAGPLLVAGVDRGRGLLVGLAGAGMAGCRARSLSAALDDREDFLAAVLVGERPALLGQRTGVQSTHHLRAPFRGASLMAVPLRAVRRAGEPPESLGLLLTPVLTTTSIEDARWVASVIARHLVRLAPLGRSETGPRPRADRERERARDREQRAHFLSRMSHEMRTPLNAVVGYTSMLLQGMAGPLSVDQTRMLARVDENGRRLLSLVNDVLDIARIEADRMPLTPTSFHVPALVSEVIRELDPLAAESGLAVFAEVDTSAPPLFNDRQKIKQILLTLLVNALKFTPEGTVRVACSFERSLGRFSLSVVDTGVGIALEDQPGLFADFGSPEQPRSGASTGAGLGLSIARRLARLMGGAISLASEPGKGSTFTLEIGDAAPIAARDVAP